MEEGCAPGGWPMTAPDLPSALVGRRPRPRSPPGRTLPYGRITEGDTVQAKDTLLAPLGWYHVFTGPARVRTAFLYAALIAVFGVLLPWTKGLDFLDPV